MARIRLHGFILATFVAGVAVVVWAIPLVSWQLAAGFIVVTAISELLPARMRDGVVTTLSTVVVLTAIVVDGKALSVVASLGIPLTAWRHYPDRYLDRSLFNLGQMALSAAAAGLTFELLGGRPGAPADPLNWLALLVAAVVFTLVNHFLIATVIQLTSGERIRSIFGSIVGSAILLDILYATLAILAAALFLHAGLASLLFLVVPALIARHALLSHEKENEAYERLVDSLMKAIEVKDGYTRGHTERVATLCVEVARDLDFDYEHLRAMRYAAKLHDVGKLGVPLSIINKPGKLDDEEFGMIMEHPRIGAGILGEIDFLHPILGGVLHHHERVDGDGYPEGLEGDDIPMVARIITVCDAFDAMTSTRPYRRAMSLDDAFAELDRCAGSQFDPHVIDVLRDVTERLEWEPTYEAYDDESEDTTIVPSAESSA